MKVNEKIVYKVIKAKKQVIAEVDINIGEYVVNELAHHLDNDLYSSIVHGYTKYMSEDKKHYAVRSTCADEDDGEFDPAIGMDICKIKLMSKIEADCSEYLKKMYNDYRFVLESIWNFSTYHKENKYIYEKKYREKYVNREDSEEED